MPLYEYECQQCHRHTEKIQKFSDTEITVCPHCGGLLERVISAPAIAFKGGGWYADGYGNAKPSASKSESKSEGGTTSSDVPSVAAAASASKDSSPTSNPSASAAPASAPASSAPASSGSDKK